MTEQAKTGPVRVRIAFRCPECGRAWTIFDDPDEWAYGHDCEDEEEQVRGCSCGMADYGAPGHDGHTEA